LSRPLFFIVSRPPRSTLSPYTTLFRSGDAGITQGKQTTVDIDPGRTLALDDVLESWFGSNGATGTLEVRPLTVTTTSTTSTALRSEEHTSELQSLRHLVCRLLLEKKKN